MKIIVCVDDRFGMSFNKRRQSSDRAVCNRIREMTKGSVLWMNSYSASLFADTEADIRIDDFLNAAEDDYCFAENLDVAPYIPQAREIILFRWNRAYPGDLHFPAQALEEMKLIRREEFPGNSHDCITQEIYRR